MQANDEAFVFHNTCAIALSRLSAEKNSELTNRSGGKKSCFTSHGRTRVVRVVEELHLNTKENQDDD